MFHVSRLPLPVVSFAAVFGLSSAVWAEEPRYRATPTGTQGTAPLTLSIENRTDADLNCTAALAHWFSEDLGVADPSAALVVALRHDPVTGTVARMNDAGDRMPVEAITCTAGKDRARIDLPVRAGAVPNRLSVVCRAGPLICAGS